MSEPQLVTHKPIERYTGPYERWVFSEDLGRPYSFPLIAQGNSTIYTALFEGLNMALFEDRGDFESGSGKFSIRVPLLWSAGSTPQNFTPFLIRSKFGQDRSLRSETVVLDEILQELTGPSFNTLISISAEGDTDRVRRIKKPRFRLNFPVLPSSWVESYEHTEPPANWTVPSTPPKAIIAVIDDGLPFAHRAFLGTDGMTKISHCWLQSGRAEAFAHVPFGREMTNAEIDELRALFPTDDAAIYRLSGAADPNNLELGNNLRRHATHGSHVMGIAAGNDSLFEGETLGDDIQIICVQLPNTIAWDTSGFGKEMYMLSAIHYVFERARQIAEANGEEELPLIVNFSYGWSAGRHDGKSEMETAIQDLLEARKAKQITEFVMPSGNNFDSRMHARLNEGQFSTNTAQIGWHLQPDDRTSSFLELWFPGGFDPVGYNIILSPPNGVTLDNPAEISAIGIVTSDGDPRTFVDIKMAGEYIGQMSMDQHLGNRWRIMLALIPTVYTRGQARRAPAGLWTVSVTRDTTARALGEQDDLLIWLQRDDDPAYLKSLGRQSYLVSLSTSDQGDPITGFGALNAVASSKDTIRVGGLDQNSGRPALYSGAGGVRTLADGTQTTWGEQVLVSAVSDVSTHRPGVPSIGVLSGSRSRLIGTSGAAPIVARQLVLNAAAGRDVWDGFVSREPETSEQPEGPLPFDHNTARLGLFTAADFHKRS